MNKFPEVFHQNDLVSTGMILFFVAVTVIVIYTIFSAIWYHLSTKPIKEGKKPTFFNKHPLWATSKDYDTSYRIITIIVFLAFIFSIQCIYSGMLDKTQKCENELSEMIELNTHRYVGKSKIICINDSKYSVTQIDGCYHFLYISDRGLAESYDVPIENTVIYYCNLDDEYFIDIYEFSGERFYVLYIPENTVYVVN